MSFGIWHSPKWDIVCACTCHIVNAGPCVGQTVFVQHVNRSCDIVLFRAWQVRSATLLVFCTTCIMRVGVVVRCSDGFVWTLWSVKLHWSCATHWSTSQPKLNLVLEVSNFREINKPCFFYTNRPRSWQGRRKPPLLWAAAVQTAQWDGAGWPTCHWGTHPAGNLPPTQRPPSREGGLRESLQRRGDRNGKL